MSRTGQETHAEIVALDSEPDTSNAEAIYAIIHALCCDASLVADFRW